MRIENNKLQEMFDKSGVSKDKLYDALRQMGTKHLKNSTFKKLWSPEYPDTMYCYVIAEFVWFYIAPEGSKPYSVKVPGDPGLHRFILWPDNTIVDLAVRQFNNYEELDYSKARVRYFLQTGCKGPSKRARMLAEILGYTRPIR